MSADTDRLREAAALIRAEAPTTLMAAVADWLEAEATVVEAIPPLHKLIWGVDIEFRNGLSSVIEVGVTDDDKEQLRSSTTPHGLAVANAVLGGAR